MTAIFLPCGRSFEIDPADERLLDGMNWHSDPRKHTTYVRGRVPGQSKGGVYLHNIIIGGRADHIDGDGLNNRRANLRPCTQAQNGLNRAAKAGKRFKGVYQRGERFYAQVYLNRRARGSYGHKTAEEAARAYDSMAMDAHGAFARLNFPPT